MKYGSLLLALLFIGSTSWAAEPRLEWTYTTGGKIYASPLIADLDGDGSQEIIVCASRDHRVLCLDGEGEVIWDYRLETAQADGVMAAPSIVDYDGDGMKEVFFLTKGGVAGCLDARGKLIWRTATGDVIDYTGPVVADINSDGRVEVVFGSDSGTLYCLDDAGMELWHYQGDGEIRGIPALAFHPESGTYRIYTVFADGMSACFSSTGDLLWSHMEPAPRNERRSGAAVADLNGDGTPEVILANEKYEVIVRNAFSGDEVWRFLKIARTYDEQI
ncbi:MAG: VCBS repeat-containing protein, partial [Candidatus Hydrogenedentes bacterium]|nr:VCBS repeat-containing protein [Candidatus Hydrogenedentota bacterium]